MHVTFPPELAQGLLRPSDAVFPPAELVADSHEDLAETFALPGWEDEDAGEVVVVPAHFFFAEEADDLGGGGAACALHGRGRVEEEVVIEGGHVKEDGFVVEEELGEKGEVLGEELVLLAIYFIYGVDALLIDWSAWRLIGTARALSLRSISRSVSHSFILESQEGD